MSLLSCWPGGPERLLPEKLHSPSTQLISADGEFDEKGFNSFLKYVKYHEHGVESNALVVAIIGQQSSGKSTLMNHLFHTNFKEMDALRARGATTKGIWIAEALETKPLTIAVDLEGTDGSERGEDDKAFERRSALFALVISDVLIVNMCCKNVGLDQGGNRPLLKIIFEVMMRLFPPHKTTLLFVLRDKTKSSIEMLESDLKKDVKKIWETALKPPGHENTPLSQIFNVEVAALSNYESTPDLFAEEVARLRCRLFNSIGRRNQHVVVPGSEIISFNGAKITWDIIKGCKDLDFPSHKVMVSTVRCEEIAMEKLRLFASNEKWLALKEAARSSLDPDFSSKISLILNKYLIEYESECMYYDNKVRGEKREYLKSEASKVMIATIRCEEVAKKKLGDFASNKKWLALREAAASCLDPDFSSKISSILNIYRTEYESECMYYDNKVRGEKLEYLMSEASKVVRPAYMNTLDHRRSEALKSFDTELKTALSEGGGFAESVRTCQEAWVRHFDEQCGSDDAAFSNPDDVSTVRHHLLRDIENNWTSVRAKTLRQIADQQLERLRSTFGRELSYIVNDTNNDDVWGLIRSLLRSESDAAALALPSALADFELDQPTVKKMVDDLRQSAKELMVKKFKEVTEDVVTLLKRRFVTAMHPTNSEASNEIEEVIQPTDEDAYLKCVKLLSTMAVIRLDEREGEGEGNDRVESVLLRALMPTVKNADSSPDPLDSPEWPQEQVPTKMTLITPVRCKDIWNQFKVGMEEHYATAMVVQERLRSTFGRELRYIVNDTNNDDVWGRIRSLLRSESDAAALALPSALAHFELDQPTVEKMVDDLRQSARKLMVEKFKEETQDVLTLLTQRFISALRPTNSEASNEIKEAIQPTKEGAYLKCVKLLSTMAVIRLNEREGGGEGVDRVESLLLRALIVPPAADAQNSPDPLDSLTWEHVEVPLIMTLITPVRCRDIWNQFKAEMEQTYANSMLVQEQCMGTNNWQPYTWVIFGLLALGLVGCGGFVFYIIRYKAVLDLDFALKAIFYATTSLGVVSNFIGVIQEAIALWQAYSKASNVTEFCEKFDKIAKNIAKALEKLYESVKSIVERSRSTTVHA